jgi:hypothetical protein
VSQLESNGGRPITPDQQGEYTAAEREEYEAQYDTAFTDFFGTPSRTVCLYKTGPAWAPPVIGIWSYPIHREMRPVYDDHPIAVVWEQILDATAKYLDASSIPFSAIAGFGMADRDNGGSNQPPGKAFCPLVVSIGVLPRRVKFEQAKAVAQHVKGVILSGAGFGHIDVAIREWRTVPLCHDGKLDFLTSMDLDDITPYQKPLSSTPSLSIASLEAPDVGGSASLFFRLTDDSDEVFLLTSGHLTRPSSSNGSHAPSRADERQKIILLDSSSYEAAKKKVSKGIEFIDWDIRQWEDRIGCHKQEQERGDGMGIDEANYKLRRERGKVERLRAVESQLAAEEWSTAERRVIGEVVHVDPIVRGPTGSLVDWAAIKLDNDRFNWGKFGGNKIYLGAF